MNVVANYAANKIAAVSFDLLNCFLEWSISAQPVHCWYTVFIVFHFAGFCSTSASDIK